MDWEKVPAPVLKLHKHNMASGLPSLFMCSTGDQGPWQGTRKRKGMWLEEVGWKGNGLD